MSYSASVKATTYSEPEVYYAEYPSTEQQRRYAFQGAIASLFVTSLILIALSVS
jgi:hypothetical protein